VRRRCGRAGGHGDPSFVPDDGTAAGCSSRAGGRWEAQWTFSALADNSSSPGSQLEADVSRRRASTPRAGHLQLYGVDRGCLAHAIGNSRGTSGARTGACAGGLPSAPKLQLYGDTRAPLAARAGDTPAGSFVNKRLRVRGIHRRAGGKQVTTDDEQRRVGHFDAGPGACSSTARDGDEMSVSVAFLRTSSPTEVESCFAGKARSREAAGDRASTIPTSGRSRRGYVVLRPERTLGEGGVRLVSQDNLARYKVSRARSPHRQAPPQTPPAALLKAASSPRPRPKAGEERRAEDADSRQGDGRSTLTGPTGWSCRKAGLGGFNGKDLDDAVGARLVVWSPAHPPASAGATRATAGPHGGEVAAWFGAQRWRRSSSWRDEIRGRGGGTGSPAHPGLTDEADIGPGSPRGARATTAKVEILVKTTPAVQFAARPYRHDRAQRLRRRTNGRINYSPRFAPVLALCRGCASSVPGHVVNISRRGHTGSTAGYRHK